jgi:HPt (histidine-containing phosphotransfer) domain-containing protein
MNDYLAKPVELGPLADVLARWAAATDTGSAAQTPDEPAAVAGDAVFNAEALMGRLMGDRQLGGLILRGFLEDAPSALDNLRRALDRADAIGIQSEAHALKGAAATVSAERLNAIALAMESAGKGGELDRCGELLPRAVEELERFKSTLEREGWAPAVSR